MSGSSGGRYLVRETDLRRKLPRLLTVGFAAAPAAAGGLLPIASPAFGTSCANHGGPHASGATTHGTGTANGNLAGLPISDPVNHCGGADLSTDKVKQIMLSDMGPVHAL